MARGAWWEVLQDPGLNELESRIEVSNNTLRAAQSQFDQARALVRGAQASQYPAVGGAATAVRYSTSENRPNRSLTAAPSYTDYLVRLDASYEFDVWGRVRSSVAASRASAQASAADLEAVRLSLHAELAANYLTVRALDADRAILLESVAAYEKALELTRNRYKGGIATGLDVAQAEAQLEATRAQAIDVQARRAQVEHAIAVLVGVPASAFSASRPRRSRANHPRFRRGFRRRCSSDGPTSPRPSGASRRRTRRSAWPRRRSSRRLPCPARPASRPPRCRACCKAASGFWTLAPAAAMALFDGGRRRAASDQAKAGYERALALYRETTLNAFREVEDQLATLRVLEEEATVQKAALAAAERALAMSINRYRGGIATYLEVVVTQNATLTNRRVAASILGRRMTASVLLIKALGGGW